MTVTPAFSASSYMFLKFRGAKTMSYWRAEETPSESAQWWMSATPMPSFLVTRSAVIFIMREVPAPLAQATRILAFMVFSFSFGPGRGRPGRLRMSGWYGQSSGQARAT